MTVGRKKFVLAQKDIIPQKEENRVQGQQAQRKKKEKWKAGSRHKDKRREGEKYMGVGLCSQQ